MSFFQSIEFAQAVALVLSGMLLGFMAALMVIRWHTRRWNRRAMRSRKPAMIKPEWTGFDRRDQWETIICDRRQ